MQVYHRISTTCCCVIISGKGFIPLPEFYLHFSVSYRNKQCTHGIHGQMEYSHWHFLHSEDRTTHTFIIIIINSTPSPVTSLAAQLIAPPAEV